jgi:hypothetical protein
MTDEKQKKTTEDYRSNYDKIFKKPKQEKQNENTPRTNP